MKSYKILAGILAVLGFQAQSCVGTDEYGCPYTTYKTHGTVQDEKGNKIKGAEVNVKIDVIVEKQDLAEKYKDTINLPIRSAVSDKKGRYETTHGDFDRYESLNYEVVTNKDGYEPDTIRKEVKRSDFKFKNGDDWETVATHEINVTLKRK